MKNHQGISILITTCMMVLLWIGFNIWHSRQESTITETQNIQILPIVGTFDVKTIDLIKKRVPIAPNYSPQTTQPQPTTPASPAATITPVVSPTASLSATPTTQATSGGILIP